MRVLKRAGAVIGLVLMFAFPADAALAEGECQVFNNHSGHVPGSYDYAEFYEDGQLVTAVETNGEDIFVNPEGFDAGSSWDQVRKCYNTDLIEQPVQIEGECAVDQSGNARALFNAEGRPGAVFTVNGVDIGGAQAGGTAQFGLNTWSVTALEGYVIVGPTEGTFTIEDCGTTTTTQPSTTTTVVETTTTTLPVTSTEPAPTTTAPVPSTPTPSTSAPELPFTGPAHVVGLTLLGLALVGLGVSAIQWGQDDE